MAQEIADTGGGAPGPVIDGALVEALRAGVEPSEEARELSPATVRAMQDAGLFRIFVPKRFGGDEYGLRTMSRCARETARHDANAAWVLMVSTAHDMVVGAFPEAAQRDVQAKGPDGVFPGSLANTGEMVPTEGGWRLTGRFPFASGTPHGDWVMAGTFAVTEKGRVPHHVVVPAADMVSAEDWNPLGLRGTGSVTLVADDVFVPEHRAIRSGTLFRNEAETLADQETTLYRTPIVPGLSCHLASVMVGIAEAAHADAVDRIRGQGDRYMHNDKIDRPGLQMRLATADADVRNAASLLDHTLSLLEEAAGGNDSIELRGQARFQASYVCELTQGAVERLVTASGARAAFEGSVLQRAHRDITMARTHAMIDLDTSAQVYGKILLGLDPGRVPL